MFAFAAQILYLLVTHIVLMKANNLQIVDSMSVFCKCIDHIIVTNMENKLTYEFRLTIKYSNVLHFTGPVIREIFLYYLIILDCFTDCVFPQEMANAAYPAYMLETRKTAPALRLVDKWAVWTLDHFLAIINNLCF